MLHIIVINACIIFCCCHYCTLLPVLYVAATIVVLYIVMLYFAAVIACYMLPPPIVVLHIVHAILAIDVCATAIVYTLHCTVSCCGHCLWLYVSTAIIGLYNILLLPPLFMLQIVVVITIVAAAIACAICYCCGVCSWCSPLSIYNVESLLNAVGHGVSPRVVDGSAYVNFNLGKIGRSIAA